MAVYTKVNLSDLNRFLEDYEIGAVSKFEGIQEGVENTNYRVVADRGAYILTLFERRVRAEDLPYFLALMEHLASVGVRSARPIKNRNGKALGSLCGRPAAMIEFLEGTSTETPSLVASRNTGVALAQLHEAGRSFPEKRNNGLGPDSWTALYEKTAPHADGVQAGLAELMGRELNQTLAAWPRDLPSGVIHADLFPDNVLFNGDQVTGLIDFYFACTDFFAYDLAVTFNAWCFDDEGAFLKEHSAALVAGYQSVRALNDNERAALPTLARGAALRFILTRLYDWIIHDPNALVTPKDPLALLPRLRFHAMAQSPSAYGA